MPACHTRPQPVQRKMIAAKCRPPASQMGTYAIRGLPAGEFLVAAANGSALARWDAGTIEALAGLATRVTIARGDVKPQNLTTRPLR